MEYAKERRKFIRLEIPVEVHFIFESDDHVYHSNTKNISAEGIRFTSIANAPRGSSVKLEIRLLNSPNPIHANGKVIWCKRLSLEDGAPYDVGIEFNTIEEDNKNTFLKFLCDVIYEQIQKMGAKK